MAQIRHSPCRLLNVILLLSSIILSAVAIETKIKFKVVNRLPDAVELFWVGHDGTTYSQGVIGRDDYLDIESFQGHMFMYSYRGLDHNILVGENTRDVALTEEKISHDLKFQLTLRNELPDPVEITWKGDDGLTHSHGIIMSGGELNLFTFPNHVFSYVFDEKKFDIRPTDSNQSFIILQGDEDQIEVTCWTSVTSLHTDKPITISVQPTWSPRGAARFLDLIREGYYNGVAINRVVPHFLAQFGIAADYDTRMHWRAQTFRDDPPLRNFQFQPGMVSFAGSGEHTRTTQIFVVMPGTTETQLRHFGSNSWETPFGIVKNVEATAVPHWYSYGDMPPWGDGPDPAHIFRKNGYQYLKEYFPMLDYIDKCEITQWPTVGEEL